LEVNGFHSEFLAYSRCEIGIETGIEMKGNLGKELVKLVGPGKCCKALSFDHEIYEGKLVMLCISVSYPLDIF
jgi:hypothetical protein